MEKLKICCFDKIKIFFCVWFKIKRNIFYLDFIIYNIKNKVEKYIVYKIEFFCFILFYWIG